MPESRGSASKSPDGAFGDGRHFPEEGGPAPEPVEVEADSEGADPLDGLIGIHQKAQGDLPSVRETASGQPGDDGPGKIINWNQLLQRLGIKGGTSAGPVGAAPAATSGEEEPGTGTQGVSDPEPTVQSDQLDTEVRLQRVSSDPAELRLMDAADRYAERTEVGRGGMGVVFRVWDNALHRPIAMKVLRGHPTERHLVDRFLREAKITGQLTHPGVVPVHELGKDDQGNIFFTMRIVSGTRLDKVFRLARERKQGWQQARVLSVLIKVCDTLAYAHSRGVIHRDVKPANIMVGKFGETYVMDWGAAKVVGEKDDPPLDRDEAAAIDAGATRIFDAEQSIPTIQGQVLGTPPYMPPEQADGQIDRLDERSDVYSVGAILYEFLAGKAPYVDRKEKRSPRDMLALVSAGPPRSLQNLARDAPGELVAICQKAMSRRKKDRYENMGALAEDLHSYLENRVVRAYKTGAVVEFRKWVERNKGVAIANVAAVIIALAGLLGVLWTQLKSNHRLRLANQEEKQARENKEGLFLAWQSTNTLRKDPGLAVLLAIEAHKRNSELLVRNALYAAIQENREWKTLVNHDGDMECAAVSPDGTRIVSGGADGTVAIWNVETGRRESLLLGHESSISHAIFSRDGELLATSSSDKTARVWEVASGRLKYSLSDHQSGVSRAAFSPAGKSLAIMLAKKIRVYDLATGNVESELFANEFLVGECEFHPLDPGIFAAGTRSGNAIIWEVSTGRKLAVLGGHRGGVSSLRFSADGNHLVTAAGVPWEYRSKAAGGEEVSMLVDGSDTSVRVWRCDITGLIQRGEDSPLTPEPHRVMEGSGALVRAAALSGDGTKVAAGFADGQVLLWDLAEEESGPRRLTGHEGDVRRIHFSPNGDRFLTMADDRTVRIWHSESGALLDTFRGHQGKISAVAFSPVGRFVMTASKNAVRLWAGSDYHPIRAGGPKEGASVGTPVKFLFNPAEFRVEDPLLVSWSPSSPEVEIRDVFGGGLVAVLEHGSELRSVAYAPDGKTLVTRTRAGRFHVWNGITGKPLGASPAGGVRYVDFRISEDGTSLVAVSKEDKVCELWNLQPLTRLRQIPTEERENLAIEPGGPRVLISPEAIEDTNMRLVDLRTGEQLRLESFGLGPHHASFSPDRRRVITAEFLRHNAFALWNGEDGRKIRVEGGGTHQGPLLWAKFSPDSGSFITLSQHQMNMWDAESGDQLLGLPMDEPASNFFYSPKGERIVMVSSRPPGFSLWALETDRRIRRVGGMGVAVNNVIFSPDGGRFGAQLAGQNAGALFDAGTGQMLARLEGHGNKLSEIKFSPDGRWILASGEDGRILSWPSVIIDSGQSFAPRALTPDEIDRFRIGTSTERRLYSLNWRFQWIRDDLALVRKLVRTESLIIRKSFEYYQAVLERLERAVSSNVDLGSAVPPELHNLRLRAWNDRMDGENLARQLAEELDLLLPSLEKMISEILATPKDFKVALQSGS